DGRSGPGAVRPALSGAAGGRAVHRVPGRQRVQGDDSAAGRLGRRRRHRCLRRAAARAAARRRHSDLSATRRRHSAMKIRGRAFDPIDLEILWNRLILVVDEAAYAIVRTSMSKVVVEGRDFGSLLLDPQGRLLAADVSVASKTGTISIAVKEILK